MRMKSDHKLLPTDKLITLNPNIPYSKHVCNSHVAINERAPYVKTKHSNMHGEHTNNCSCCI